MDKHIAEIERLFKQHHKGLCHVAWRILGDQAAAKDVVQDVFMTVWRRRQELDLNSSLKGYLYKAVSNASLNQLEKQAKVVRLEENTTEELLAIGQLNEANPEEMDKAVTAAIDRLPPKCKTIFVLSKYEGLKYREIAAQLDISNKTVEAQMSIALQKLRTELKPLLAKLVLVSIPLLSHLI